MYKKIVMGTLSVAAILGAAIFILKLDFQEPAFSVQNNNQILKKEPEQYTLLFTGDIMLDRGVEYSVRNNGSGDPKYSFELIADVLKEADLTIGNLEGPISSRGTRVGSIYSFRFDPAVIDALTYAGFDVFSLANNHIWDYGSLALTDTVSHLKSAGIVSVGAGSNSPQANQPHVATVGSTTIAFLSYTNLYPESLYARDTQPGISNPDIEILKSKILNLKSENDLVILLWHWGDEYQALSHPREQEIAHALIDAGADLIVGHHPHVVQEIEQYKGKYIAYSLGNFVFDQSFSKETMEGLILKMVVQDKEIISVEPINIKISPAYQPYIPTAQN